MTLPKPSFQKELKLFWNKGVKKVSPQTLGMALQNYPLEVEDCLMICERLSFAHWGPNLVDGWIVLTADPMGE